MSRPDDDNGPSGERGKAFEVALMHPQASMVQGRRHFFPFGCTPPENLLGSVPKDARRADMLLLGCSDARHALFTLWVHGSECARERLRCASEATVTQKKPNPNPNLELFQPLRTLRFTLNDREPACLARVLLLLQLFMDSHEQLVKACALRASAQQREAYATRIALCFNAYYNVYVDSATLSTLQGAARNLLEASVSTASWGLSRVGSISHVAGHKTLDCLRSIWYVYADTSILQFKPKKTLDTERNLLHQQNASAMTNMSAAFLGGEGPGLAAAKSMEWGPQVTGIHHRYQKWGYLDPFPVLTGAAKSHNKYYTKTNPAMICTEHQELDFELHYTCNPLSAFHQDAVWLNLKHEAKEADEGGGGGVWPNGSSRSLRCGPPGVSSNAGNTVHIPMKRFGTGVGDPQEDLQKKLLSTSLEQLSKMCWAVNWAYMEAVDYRSGGRAGAGASSVDVRMNFVAGDAVDTCDTICMLTAEGQNAFGTEGGERVCAYLPHMSISSFRLDLADIGGSGRFDLIDSSDLSETLGVLNVVMAASPLLKPVPHAILRTDLRRSGASRKRRFSPPEGVSAEPEFGASKDAQEWAAASYCLRTEEDWCTTQVQECAMLLGVVPVDGISPIVGFFHSMLEAARMAKSNRKSDPASGKKDENNKTLGDVGQRLRLAWKQACLIDGLAGAYVGSKVCTAMTLHPRLRVSATSFSTMVMPFWMFMSRSFYAESATLPQIGHGDERQVRTSPYTAASFARLIAHSLRFLKLDFSHPLKVVEDLHAKCSKGIHGADVVSQLDVHLYLLALYKTEALAAPDVVRWARQCPWWEKKPPPEGSTLVPALSPGVCRIVMIAPKATVEIMRELRDVPLCVVLDDTSQRVLYSSLHLCFVQVHRGGRSSPPGPGVAGGGDPWYSLRDNVLAVSEVKSDDPRAELMVSFVLDASTLLNAEVASEVVLELRLQDSTGGFAAPRDVADALHEPKGLIFRTDLGSRVSTAVLFPPHNTAKKPDTTLLEPWPQLWGGQSVRWEALLRLDRPPEQRRVGKGSRYVITPATPEIFTPNLETPLEQGDWKKKPNSDQKLFLWNLQMSNPAARSLLQDKQTSVALTVIEPCGLEIELIALEKNDRGKGKKKHRTRAEDLGRGGIDGGLRYMLVLPYPIASLVHVVSRDKDLRLRIPLKHTYMPSPFVNVVQTIGVNGDKLSPPLLSNWSFPVRSAGGGMRLDHSADLLPVVKEIMHWRKTSAITTALEGINQHFCSFIQEFIARGAAKGAAGGVSGGTRWHWCELTEDYAIMLCVHDVLVDESNECLLLDACVAWVSREVSERNLDIAAARKAQRVHFKPEAAALLTHMLPMAVERGRKTYSHEAGCSYRFPKHSSATGIQDIDADDDGMPMCRCGAGKDLPDIIAAPRPGLTPNMYRAVLPTLVPSAGWRDADSKDQGFGRFVSPPGPWPQRADSYSGPTRAPGSIVESVPATAVRERGGGSGGRGGGKASGAGSAGRSSPVTVTKHYSNNGYGIGKGRKNEPFAGVNPRNVAILIRCGFSKMPDTTAGWARFERVKKDLPADPSCATCGKLDAKKRCTDCKIVHYCSKFCQKKDWPTHKTECFAD